MDRVKTGLLFLILLSINLSCSDPNVFYLKSFELPDSGWMRNYVLEDSLTLENAISDGSVILSILHSQEFDYQNLYLKGQISKGDVLIWTDTFSIQLAQPNGGQWLGNNIDGSLVVTDTLPYFLSGDQSSNVSFEFAQFSRDKVLTGIEEVNVKIANNSLGL